MEAENYLAELFVDSHPHLLTQKPLPFTRRAVTFNTLCSFGLLALDNLASGQRVKLKYMNKTKHQGSRPTLLCFQKVSGGNGRCEARIREI